MRRSSTVCVKTLLAASLNLFCTASGAEEKSIWSDNLRLTLDVSSRGAYFSAQNQTGFMHAAGFDLHKVFSTDRRDIGTLTLQGYLTRIDNFAMVPGIFDDGDDTEFVYRIFNFNYTGFSTLPNIRIGHFEVPYGLEHIIDTNGTLRQYQQPQNLGIKADWGVSLNKQLSHFEYEVAATTGGNQELEPEDGSYVYSARIGSPRDGNTVFGLSAYSSRLKNVKRERLGIDVSYYYGLYGWLGEASVGKNNGQDVLNGLVEWNYRSRNESLLYYGQFSYLSTEATGNSALKGIVGAKYTPDNHWSLSAQYARDINVFAGKEHQGLFNLQVRYRF